MRASEVLRQQYDLLTLLDSGAFDHDITNTLEYRFGKHAPSTSGARHELTDHLRLGDAYHVEANMTAIAIRRALSEDMSTTTFADHQPPSQHGLMVFEEPVRRPERRGRMSFTHLVTWGVTVLADGEHALAVAEWNDLAREPDEVMVELAEQYEGGMPQLQRLRWSMITLWTVGFARPVGPAWITLDQEGRERLARKGISSDSAINIMRVVCAMWDLMGETIPGIDRREAPLTRADRRSAARNNLRPRVVVLRRQTPSEPTRNPGSGRPLDKRVTVHEHWRNQPYGPGRKLRKRIKIAEHEKGPEHAPRSRVRKVYNLQR